MLKQIGIILSLIIVLTVLLFIPAIACAPPRAQTVPPSSDNRDFHPGFNLPPIPDPDKGIPKLDGHLNQLILEEKQGKAEEFARQLNIKLIDGKVRVQIEAMPGQLDAAVVVTAATGTVEIISYTLNMVEAVVPITSLAVLAEKDSIRFIRIPVPPTPPPGN